MFPKDSTNAITHMSQCIKREFNGQSGIIYCLSKKECEDVAGKLQCDGIKADFYHADVPNRDQKQVLALGECLMSLLGGLET